MEFVKGDAVRLIADPRANVGVVTDVILDRMDPQYEVLFPGSSKSIYGAHSLVADGASGVTGDAPDELLGRGEWVGAEDFRSFITLAKLATPLTDNLYSFAASRTERLPHQFKAVLKLLNNPHGRLLIADEVGLGKTIEAGIILTELAARSPLNNVLIACPSPLKEKWRAEMRERFLLDFEVASGTRLRQAIKEATEDAYPEPLRLIASLELLRREENLEYLSEAVPALDLVIVDEAHHMRNSGTKTNLLGDLLGEVAETMIFLTATPLNLGRPDFFELMRLLVPSEFGDPKGFSAIIEPNRHLNSALRLIRAAKVPAYAEALKELEKVEQTAQRERFRRSPRYRSACELMVRGARGEDVTRDEAVACQRDLLELNTLSQVFTRTRKREVQELFPTRRSTTVSVEFTAKEKRFYDAVTEWTLREYEDRAAHLVVITFQRMATSCLPALGRRLIEARRDQMVALTSDELSEVVEEIDNDTPLGDEHQADVVLQLSPELADSVAELSSAWESYGGATDSKFEAFAKALMASFDEGAGRILVFSYFTATIDYLADRLAQLEVNGRPLRVLRLYGPMNREQRERAVEQFRSDSGPVVLISSEVGSEGLDFQFCSRMFNYDLPWNPMRVEQRIGRLDRYGQASELIHIINMIVSDTIEERIFFRLYDRIQIFEESIGDLEAILGELEADLAKLQREALSGALTAAEQERRSDAIADVIIRNQQENKIFEKESKQFLSNDDVFLDLFNDIERGRRYVTPEELHSLVVRFLEIGEYPVRLDALTGRPNVYVLNGDVESFRRKVAGPISRNVTNARDGRAFLGRVNEGLLATFEPQIATVDRGLEFISIKHPLVEMITAEHGGALSASSCGLLALPLGGSRGESKLLFVFELRAQGVKDTVEFRCVVVNKDLSIDTKTSTGFLAALEQATEAADRPPVPRAGQVEEAFAAARGHIATTVAERERELQQSLDETIAARVESLRLSTEHRLLRLREMIETIDSVAIVRMYKAQLERLERDYDAKRAAIESKRGVTVSYRLVAAGCLVDSGDPAVAASSN